MLRTLVRRLLILMVAFALGSGPATVGPGMAMAGTAPMASPSGADGTSQPCRHCPTHEDGSMMACAALGCAGAIADRPAGWVPFVPTATSIDYATLAAADPADAVVAPDPYPPKISPRR
jgi:hypothetical protein